MVFVAGLALFSAFSIQTFGLRLTTPGKNAFLTAVYCTIVPLLSWLLFRKKPEKSQIYAALLCFIGVGFVSLDSSLNMNLGDVYTLMGGFLYAVHIIVCEKAIEKYFIQLLLLFYNLHLQLFFHWVLHYYLKIFR